MQKKRFVSIVFTGKKIFALLLNNQQSKVLQFGSIDIPPGVVVQHSVQNVDALADLIKSSVKKLGIKEKSVGIVIPEFSTYTKLLKIPNIEREDLDEAVRWQSQEFLPESGVDMNLDWRIIKEDQGEYKILMVSVPMKVLSGYIEAVSLAGLMPLVVETPSISITRVAELDEETRLLVYVSPDETVLVVCQGKSILASSVANSTSVNEILQTAQRMVSHFSSTPIKEVKVGGVNLSQQFIDSVKNALNLPVSSMAVKVDGMNEVQIQEFLVAISLQKKDPAQPENEYTVNLLPPIWAKHYKDKIRDRRIWTLTQGISIGVWTCFLAVFITYMLLNSQLADLRSQHAAVKDPKSEEALNQIKQVNDLTSRIIKIDSSRKDPVKVINVLATAKPQGVRVTDYQYNVESGEVKILGKADTRDLLIAYKQELEKLEGVSQVSLPISSIVSELNINFELRLGYEVQKAQAPVKLKL